MSEILPTSVIGSQRWVAAAALSSVIHFSAILLVVAAIDGKPRGASDFNSDDIGLVLSDEAGESNPSAPVAARQVAVTPTSPTPNVSPPAADPSPPASTGSPGLSHSLRIAQAPFHASGPGEYGPPGDGQTSVRVFGVEGKGSRFVYVFDRSSSMDGAPLATAKQQLIQSLESLSSVNQFHIIFFNQQLRHFDLSGGGKRIAFATDRNKKLAERFVGGITADGGTDRLPALRAAVQLQPDVIFFLTDADDPMPKSELEEISELNRRAGVVISTIEFGRGPSKQAKNFLTELARTTGGQYGYVDTQRLASPAH
jgi:hypothetical protein